MKRFFLVFTILMTSFVIVASCTKKEPSFVAPASNKALAFITPLKGIVDASVKDMGYPGILILSVPNDRNETVVASEEGIVFFAGKDSNLLSGYGKLVIIFHRYGYESVYTGLDKVFVKPQQIVRKGEPIGTVGSWKGKRGIYFVIRKRTANGKVYSIDPRKVVSGF